MKLPYLSQNYSKKEHVTIVSILLVVVFTCFILTIVSTAGSTANYKPITNIYLGNANIAHINVTKVLPQMGPVLTILGTALTAPNRTLDNIFDALRTVADTPALTPLMYLLSNAQNISLSIISLTNLAPLAISGNPITDTKELVEMSGLLKLSQNQSETLLGLKDLVQPILEDFNPDDNTTKITLDLLSDSNDPTIVTESLYGLNQLTLSEKISMLPVFALFDQTNNITNLMLALQTIMDNSEEVSTASSETLLSTVQTMLTSNPNANITTVFNTILGLASNDYERQSIQAIELMLQDSKNVNQTLNTLSEIIANNVTESETSKEALESLTTILSNVNNTETALSTIQQLATITNNTVTNQQLLALENILDATDEDEETIKILADLQTGLNPNSTTFKYIPYLFSLLSASSNPPVTFSSLVTLTAWAQENPATFTPIISILNDALSVQMVSQAELREMTPTLLEYLEIPINYRLSIFTLCTANLENEVIECSAPRAVQNMDFRQIIYDSLINSQFAPYLRALDIQAEDLSLDGTLQHREHEYVPSIKAVLSMNILSIVFSFFVMITLGLLFWLRWSSKRIAWITVILLSMSTTLFLGLSSTVLAVVIEIIKSGTYDDDYGVIFTTGVSYAAMLWCSFGLMVIVSIILLWCGWTVRHLIMPSRFLDSDLEKSDGIDSGITTLKEEVGYEENINRALTDESSGASQNEVNEKPNNTNTNSDT